MTTHVFIVDENTFPVHLEYRFAGTTAGLGISSHIGLYADIARVRPGDRVYFYRLRKGFYGPFKIDPQSKGVWWDPLNPTYLQDKLKLRLIYRVKVIADNSYPIGISEWESLDKYLRDPEKCMWSLVYRKLKGERGCTAIFPWEDEFLLELIKRKNQENGKLPLRLESNEHLTWDGDKEEIVIREGEFPPYDPPTKEHVSEPPDPLEKVLSRSGTEIHMQAFLTKNYGNFPESEIIFGPTKTLKWVGNEVACGLGMQKMDLFVINEANNEKQFRIVELKKDPPDSKTVEQFHRYIEWTKNFVKGANERNILPVLLCRNLEQQPLTSSVIDSFKEFNNKAKVLPLEYIECIKEGENIRFLKIDY